MLSSEEDARANTVGDVELARGVCVDVMCKDLMNFAAEGLHII